MEDVGVEHAAAEDACGIRGPRAQAPAEDPQIEKGIADILQRAKPRGQIDREGPRQHNRGNDIHRCRACRVRQRPSSFFNSSVTSFGLALPCVCFMTEPTRKPNALLRPLRICATASGLAATASRTIA